MAPPKSSFLDCMIPGEIQKIPVLPGNQQSALHAAQVSATLTRKAAAAAGIEGISYRVDKSRLVHPKERWHVAQIITRPSGLVEAHTAYLIDYRNVRLKKLIRSARILRAWNGDTIAAIYRREPDDTASDGHLRYRWPDGTEAYWRADTGWHFRTLEMADWSTATGMDAVMDYSDNTGLWPFEPEEQINAAIPDFNYTWEKI